MTTRDKHIIERIEKVITRQKEENTDIDVRAKEIYLQFVKPLIKSGRNTEPTQELHPTE